MLDTAITFAMTLVFYIQCVLFIFVMLHWFCFASNEVLKYMFFLWVCIEMEWTNKTGFKELILVRDDARALKKKKQQQCNK